MENNSLTELSLELAGGIIDLSETLKKTSSDSYAVSQLLRSGTCVGESIFEALYSHKGEALAQRLSNALRLTNDTSYWLKLLFLRGAFCAETYSFFENQCEKIRRLLITATFTAEQIPPSYSIKHTPSVPKKD